MQSKKALSEFKLEHHNKDVLEIAQMLTYRRPKNSQSEANFINRFIIPLGVIEDGYGNFYKIVGDPNPKVLWSCHTDTVHTKNGRQKVEICEGVIQRDSFKGGGCLGADDGGGVWLLTRMIKANKPGLYIFHREEESGGHGSNYIANQTPDLLKGIEIAIAFDRKGKRDIITHQFGSRCCSDTFADSLIAELDGDYLKDHTGSFTDTANYVDLVNECTNISIGYTCAHTVREDLDANYLQELLQRILKLDPAKLMVERDPHFEATDECYIVEKTKYIPYVYEWNKNNKKKDKSKKKDLVGNKSMVKAPHYRVLDHRGNPIIDGNKKRFGDGEDVDPKCYNPVIGSDEIPGGEDSLELSAFEELLNDEDAELLAMLEDLDSIKRDYITGRATFKQVQDLVTKVEKVLPPALMPEDLNELHGADNLDHDGPEHSKSCEVEIYNPLFQQQLMPKELETKKVTRLKIIRDSAKKVDKLMRKNIH